jgi:hypothetical protein
MGTAKQYGWCWMMWLLLLALTIFQPCALAQKESAREHGLLPKDIQEAEHRAGEYAGNLSERSVRGKSVTEAVSQLTGTAINPLFGVTVLGMWHYFSTPEHLRNQLPFYDQPYVWGVLLLLILLMFFNSTICESMPFLKIPLNALGDLVNKGGACIILPVVLYEFAQAFAPSTAVALASASDLLFPTAYAAGGSEVVIGSISGSWLLLGGLISLAVGALAYAVVWVVWNVIDVTILVLPIPFLDAILKSTRLAAMGFVFGVAALSPWLGVVISLAMILACWVLAGWAFRLSVMGFVFATDFLLWRRSGGIDATAGIPVFISATAGKQWKLPARLYGYIQRRSDDMLFFVWRPWLVGPLREIELGQSRNFQSGSTLLYPVVLDSTGNISLFRLPPRYRRDVQTITSALRMSNWRDVSIVRSAWAYLQQVFRGSSDTFQKI